MEGTVAQLVEQRTENPRVAGSIPAGATIMETLGAPFKADLSQTHFLYIFYRPHTLWPSCLLLLKDF